MAIPKTVDEILSTFGLERAPVPIKDLIESFNVGVFIQNLPNDISGVLDLRNQPAIVINRDHHPNRQRFSMAHEFGHFCLHGGHGIHVDRQTFFRDSRSSEGLDSIEIEANRFAAEILMPKTLIEAEIAAVVDWLDTNEDLLSELSQKFQVSATAMGLRLQTLGLSFPGTPF